jgi:protein arginine kinase activator
MRCDSCHERDAVVELTQIADDKKIELHLCEKCAAEKGISTSASLAKIPVGGFVAALGKGSQAAAALPNITQTGTCPACGASLEDFRETGRLGCAECYRTFEAPLRDLLRRLHGASRHLGERYAIPGGESVEEVFSRAQLQERLKLAVESERFELAAELRDRLRALEEGRG